MNIRLFIWKIQKRGSTRSPLGIKKQNSSSQLVRLTFFSLKSLKIPNPQILPIHTFSQVNHQGHPAIMVRGKPKLIRQVAVEADGHLAKQVMVLSHKKFLRLNSNKFNC